MPSPLPTEALILIDIQNDFCPGGALAVPGGDAVVPLCNRLSRRFSHVILTQDWHPSGHASFASSHGKEPYDSAALSYGTQILWPDHCVQGTHGAAFHKDLQTETAVMTLRKGHSQHIDSYSGFFENDRTTSTGLAGALRDRGVERIVLAGLATDFCVQYTALDGRTAGFEVVVVDDAVRGIDLEGSVAAAWSAMIAAGVERSSSGEWL
jgi:nicotinamidase/pyrazinamidase